MLSRRTRARLNLVVNVFAFVVVWHGWNTNEESENSLSSYWTGIGAVSSVAYYWAYDRDIRGIRRDWYRRAALSLVSAIAHHLLVRSETARNVSIGEMIGIIVYRLWYGLLHPLPGE